MADTPNRRGSSLAIFEITRCCPEAQADGVPCPVLGRSCETCERAARRDLVGTDAPTIRPVGND